MKYPIGIQDFEYIRQNNFVYVDKTAYRISSIYGRIILFM